MDSLSQLEYKGQEQRPYFVIFDLIGEREHVISLLHSAQQLFDFRNYLKLFGQHVDDVNGLFKLHVQEDQLQELHLLRNMMSQAIPKFKLLSVFEYVDGCLELLVLEEEFECTLFVLSLQIEQYLFVDVAVLLSELQCSFIVFTV